MFQKWLVAFLLTVLFEAPIVGFFFNEIKKGKLALVFLVAQLISHSLLWFVLPRFTPFVLWAFVGEALVVFLEGIIYHYSFQAKISWNKCLGLSLLANTFSCLMGLMI